MLNFIVNKLNNLCIKAFCGPSDNKSILYHSYNEYLFTDMHTAHWLYTTVKRFGVSKSFNCFWEVYAHQGCIYV